MNLNLNQKRTLIAISAIITAMLLYPPFHRIYGSGIIKGAGYHWLFDAPRYATIDVVTLLVQWVGVLLVGGIVFFIFKDNEK